MPLSDFRDAPHVGFPRALKTQPPTAGSTVRTPVEAGGGTYLSKSHYKRAPGVGSEEARLRAGLRPPLKLHVHFSRMQLSRKLNRSEMPTKELARLS
jgi:hypothetical protein